MKLVAIIAAAILMAGLGSCNVKAQVAVGGLTVTTVNNGTGSLVSVPIPGGSGLSVTVGTGSAALPLQNLANDPAATRTYISDDANVNVPLPFTFPFYGQSFNNSWMHSNGVVAFRSPNITGGFCCSGEDLSRTTYSGYNYIIAPLWTDLISINGSHYYKTTSTSATYGWYNVSEFYNPSSSNSFEVDINSSGVINTRLGGAMISNHYVTSGMAGNLANGEYYQYYHGYGLNIGTANPVSWSALGGTGAVDQCTINPLFNPSCPGYATAYLTQQCSINVLWDPTCPGYQAAYFSQQCSISPLYDSACPGYQQAYFNQQCTANPLYNRNCPGYADAYHTQQCSLDPLYMTDCPGYATAYLNLQCSLNPLYSTTCAGYQQAYFNQQCNLNGLYDRACPNYSTAYATKMLLEQQSMASTVATAGVVAQTAPTTTTTTASVSSDGTVSTPATTTTGNTTVDKAITSTTTTTNSAAAPAAPVQLVAPAPAPAAPQQQAQQEKKPEGGDKKADGAPQPTQMAGPQQDQGGSKDQPKTARQEIQERRQAAAKAEAVEKGKNLANEMGKSADMETQKAVQNVVIQAMGYTPGFDSYNKMMITDSIFYKPYAVYTNQQTVDNKRLGRGLFGPTDQLHNQMVEQQYEGR